MAGPKCDMFLQRRNDISDGMGGYTTVWYEIKKIRGTLAIVDKWEKFVSDSIRVKSTHIFMADYDPSVVITEADRLRYKNEIYEIVFADDVAKREIFWSIYLKRFQ